MAKQDTTRTPPDPQQAKRHEEYDQPTAAWLLPREATTHAFAMAGLITLARDVADMIDAKARTGEKVDSSEALDWAFRLDTIMNAATESQDAFVTVLRCAGHTAPLMSGAVIMRGAA